MSRHAPFPRRLARRADLPEWLLNPGKLASALMMLLIAAFGLGHVAILGVL